MPRRLRLIAHNIRSLWNVGSLFRTADAFAVEHVYLTGYTALPPRREISKTALGAEETVEWSSGTPEAAILEARGLGFCIIALELAENAVPLAAFKPDGNICLILGHEVTGVPAELLKAADGAVSIPMLGKKESLNVSVAAGIALNHLRNA